MSDTSTVVDASRHCTATKESIGKTVAMDCPYAGKGEEFSPTNLVEAALSGCMLLSMDAFAMRHDIDLTGAQIDVDIATIDNPVMRFESIDVIVTMPSGISEADRGMLERAADGCPIKHSFAPEIELSVRYDYPD